MKTNWRNFVADKTIPLWKKIPQGIWFGAKSAVQTLGLAITALPPIGWPLALAGWAAGQTLLYTSNALNYVRYFLDGLTTCIVNAPSALHHPEKAAIFKSSAKTMGKNALLLLPTAAILLATLFIPGAQVLPAITPIIGTKLLALLGITAAGAQLTSGMINYQFAKTHFKNAEKSATITTHNTQQITRSIAKQLVTKKTPLLANDRLIHPTIIPIIPSIPRTPTAPQKIPAAIPHTSVFLELQHREDIHEKIHHLRDTFLLKKSDSTQLAPRSTLISEDPHEATHLHTPHASNTTPHQHLCWNEHEGNAWAEYKNRDTHQAISELVALSADLDPYRILLSAITNPVQQESLCNTLKTGIKQLRAAGHPLDKTYLQTIVHDDALAQTLANHYQKTLRQTIHNHYTQSHHDYPNDKLIDLAIRQVDGFIKMHGSQKTLTISSAWDRSYVEAILLYAATQNYKCKNKSAFAIPAFSAAHVDAFKDLLAKKPYLGHRHTAPNNQEAGEKSTEHASPKTHD